MDYVAYIQLYFYITIYLQVLHMCFLNCILFLSQSGY